MRINFRSKELYLALALLLFALGLFIRIGLKNSPIQAFDLNELKKEQAQKLKWHVKANEEFGITVNLSDYSKLPAKANRVQVLFEVMPQVEDTEFFMVMEALHNTSGRKVFHHTNTLDPWSYATGKWNSAALEFPLSEVALDRMNLKVYFWNPNGQEFKVQKMRYELF